MSLVAHLSTPTTVAIERLLVSARERADTLGIRVNIAVVDTGGNLAGFIRMPGSFLSSIELAIDKAFTAVSFSMPTRSFSNVLGGAPKAVRDGLLRRPRLTEVPGGLPIEIEGNVIGAIGISGGSDEEDEDVASYAVAALSPQKISRRA